MIHTNNHCLQSNIHISLIKKRGRGGDLDSFPCIFMLSHMPVCRAASSNEGQPWYRQCKSSHYVQRRHSLLERIAYIEGKRARYVTRGTEYVRRFFFSTAACTIITRVQNGHYYFQLLKKKRVFVMKIYGDECYTSSGSNRPLVWYHDLIANHFETIMDVRSEDESNSVGGGQVEISDEVDLVALTRTGDFDKNQKPEPKGWPSRLKVRKGLSILTITSE